MTHTRANVTSPAAAEFAFERGNAAFDRAEWATAETAYLEALALNPDYTLARFNYGLLLLTINRAIDAERAMRVVVSADPQYALARLNLGTALHLQKRFADADEHFRAAATLGCTLPELNLNWSVALTELGRFTEAAALLEPLVPLPDWRADALAQLALVRLLEGKPEEAVELYRAVLRCGVRSPEAHAKLGMALLAAGDWTEGWAECEALDSASQGTSASRPRWKGEDLAGKTILLTCEQGLGDLIQFARFTEVLADRGATVYLRCAEEAAELMSTNPGIARVVREPVPDCDYQMSLLSLPHVLGVTRDNLPARVPYLRASDLRRTFWQARLPGNGTFRVGLVWRGSQGFIRNRWRSIDLEQLAPIFGVPGVTFVSLQKGLGLDELARLGPSLGLHDLGSEYQGGTLADTAAIIAELDLVISVDTSVAHLTGALARPGWVLVSEPPSDWRWERGIRTSRWYPTLRLFRQRAFGRWESVVEEAREALVRR